MPDGGLVGHCGWGMGGLQVWPPAGGRVVLADPVCGGISYLWRKGGAVSHGLSVWGAEL